MNKSLKGLGCSIILEALQKISTIQYNIMSVCVLWVKKQTMQVCGPLLDHQYMSVYTSAVCTVIKGSSDRISALGAHCALTLTS